MRGLGTKKKKVGITQALDISSSCDTEKTRSLGNLAIVGLNHQCADFFLLLLSIFPIELSFFLNLAFLLSALARNKFG